MNGVNNNDIVNNIPFSVFHNIGLYLINPMHANTVESEENKEVSQMEKETDVQEESQTEPKTVVTNPASIELPPILKPSGANPENVKRIEKQPNEDNESKITSQVMPDSPENFNSASGANSTKGCCVIS